MIGSSVNNKSIKGNDLFSNRCFTHVCSGSGPTYRFLGPIRRPECVRILERSGWESNPDSLQRINKHLWVGCGVWPGAMSPCSQAWFTWSSLDLLLCVNNRHFRQWNYQTDSLPLSVLLWFVCRLLAICFVLFFYSKIVICKDPNRRGTITV